MSDVPIELALIEGATKRLGEAIPAALDVDTRPEPAVELLATVRGLRKGLADLEAWLEGECVTRLHYGQQRLGEYVAEVRGGKDRREWRHDDLAWAVVRDVCVDTSTGEIVPEARQIVDEVRSRLLNCAQISGWRVLQLRPLGIEADDYCTCTPGRRTVQVTPAVDETAQPEPHDQAVAS